MPHHNPYRVMSATEKGSCHILYFSNRASLLHRTTHSTVFTHCRGPPLTETEREGNRKIMAHDVFMCFDENSRESLKKKMMDSSSAQRGFDIL